MRIAFVHPETPGAEGTGATHTATIIVRTLAKRGHDVTVFARGGEADSKRGASAEQRSSTAAGESETDHTVDGAGDPSGIAAQNVTIHPLDLSGRPNHTTTQLNRALRDLLQDGTFDDFDVVHSYLPSSLPALGAIGARVSARTVVTLNAYGGVCPKNDLRYMDREPCRERGLLRCLACTAATSPGHDEFGTAYRTASRWGNLRQVRAGLRRLDSVDVFQALSTTVRESYATLGYPHERIAVVPNPLDGRFFVDHETEFQPPYELLYVGALDTHKGVERLVPMVDAVRGMGIDASLTVVGEGGRRSALQRQITRRGLGDAVTLVGKRPYEELPTVYANHDLFVYPGEWDEPFGRIFLEALATETPVVATAVGATADILGEAGIVTDVTTEGLADGVATAIRDRGLASLSARARDELDRYQPERIASMLESLYAGELPPIEPQ